MRYFVCARTGEEFESAEEWLDHLKTCEFCTEIIRLTYEEFYSDTQAVK